MNVPVWMFLTILIVVCLLIAFAILAVVLTAVIGVAPLNSNVPVSLQDQKTENNEKNMIPTTNNKNEKKENEKEKEKERIEETQWLSEERTLRIRYATTLSKVRFVIRSTSLDDRSPFWISEVVLGKGTLLKSVIRDTKYVSFLTEYQQRLRNQSEASRPEFVIEMENAETYQTIASSLFHI